MYPAAIVLRILTCCQVLFFVCMVDITPIICYHVDVNVTQKILVNEIKRLRKARNMDQQDLADAVNISRSSIGNIERGKQAVSLTLFCKIANALDKNPGMLLNEILSESATASKLSVRDVRDANRQKHSNYATILTTINNAIGTEGEHND